MQIETTWCWKITQAWEVSNLTDDIIKENWVICEPVCNSNLIKCQLSIIVLIYNFVVYKSISKGECDPRPEKAWETLV
jgi:hypothetical protein